MAAKDYPHISIITDTTEKVLGFEINPPKNAFKYWRCVEESTDTAVRIQEWFGKQSNNMKLRVINTLDIVIYGMK